MELNMLRFIIRNFPVYLINREIVYLLMLFCIKVMTVSGGAVLYEQIREVKTSHVDDSESEDNHSEPDCVQENIDECNQDETSETNTIIDKAFSCSQSKSRRELTRDIAVQTDTASSIDSKLTIIMNELTDMRQCMATIHHIENLEQEVAKLSALIKRKKDKASRRHEKHLPELERPLPRPELFSPGVTFSEALQTSMDYTTAPDIFSPPCITPDIIPVTPKRHPIVEQLPQPEFPIDETSVSKKKTRKPSNKCASFIRNELTKRYSETELVDGRFSSFKRKYKDMEMNPSALSPSRLTLLLTDARRMFKEDYTALEKKDLNEIINSKCRSVKQKYRKNNLEEKI